MFSKLKRVTLISALIVGGSWPSFTLAMNSPTTKVTELYSYTEVSNGDVIFKISDEVSGCDGFWLDSISPGQKNVLAILLSAYHAQSPVIVYAKQTDLFPGSSQSFCKVTTLRLRSID